MYRYHKYFNLFGGEKMKKKLLALLLATTMSLSLIACGGGKEETATEEAAVEEEAVEEAVEEETTVELSGDYTEEQAACVAEYEQMLADYNAMIDLARETPEIMADDELTGVLNELSASIDEITEMMADPANITDEFIAGLDPVMVSVYSTINRINNMAELLPILTIAGVGVDEEENTYWFAFNEEETVGAMVILSADQTQNLACSGAMTVAEDGTYTISNEEYEMSMLVEAVEDGLVLTMQDGTEVGMVGAEPKEVIDMMLAIEEGTENVNEQ